MGGHPYAPYLRDTDSYLYMEETQKAFFVGSGFSDGGDGSVQCCHAFCLGDDRRRCCLLAEPAGVLSF